MSDLSKITFKKHVEKDLSDIKYRLALDDFIYQFGCITGWEKKEETADRSALSYSCMRTSPQPESSEYIRDLIEGIRSSNNVTINQTKFSGEIVILFEDDNGE